MANIGSCRVEYDEWTLTSLVENQEAIEITVQLKTVGTVQIVDDNNQVSP